ncbi:peptidase domain-containing ABC transporter [Chitinophaga sancti]|uniref:peptidase domain-containing ABC transporter n=1 Tax=Chitinophaga sancti TaxID=1004 RepID=UPI002A76608D|nr:peptidase domain-containing ABC transporter [Chitinophaga sancti]WPQ63676.1 peptidase domain-containing ABC transporter [Chitinophaga sancti]
MIAKFYGKSYGAQYLKKKCQQHRYGTSLLGISEGAESIGFKTLAVKIDFGTFVKKAILPCIVLWDQVHYVVVYKVSATQVLIADPARGKLKLTANEFKEKWLSIKEETIRSGVVLLLDPAANFNDAEEDQPEHKVGIDLKNVLAHFGRLKTLIAQLGLGMLVGMVLQLILPFLTQSLVDVGIAGNDLNFVTIVLVGQLMIFLGSTVVDFIRSYILLHVGTRVNISLLTEFFMKLMKLPMSYFDSKMTGDTMQRLGDHNRIQSFFTNTLLTTAFGIVNFVVFTFLAVSYSTQLFFIFLGGSILYLFWILLFMPVRKRMDFRQFSLNAGNQSLTIEMIQGMQEIKLNNAEKQKRWKWEIIQARIFKLSIRNLFINQFQSAGAMLINQAKNILVSFIAAREVINGNISLGGMMAIQYIIGQLNSPIQQIIQFIQALQDAKISMERINEVHKMEDENAPEKVLLEGLPASKRIELNNVSYMYPGSNDNYVLKNIQLQIPEGKTTAIVGTSGSGKTTLLKLLLRFYNLEEGEIRVGGSRLSQYNTGVWRGKCGIVMQEGYIFSDTIAANIAVADETPDYDRLLHAIKVANLQTFIDSLPMGMNTKIGSQGNGVSQGQKQRILIARAVYKDPDYILFDEATNSLDANNELVIMNNLESFFEGRTVVIVAHRLSTVKKADNIVVLRDGQIKESGTHESLLELRQEYYELVKNQLELGN